MVLKVEWFKYEKFGAKGVPLEYLEFSRAFEGKPCPYTHAAVIRPTALGVGVAHDLISNFWTRSSCRPAGDWMRARPTLAPDWGTVL